MPAALDTPAERRGVGEAMVDVLVALHDVDWTRLELEGFGRPSGYLERQVRRFRQLWELNRTREIPAVETVADWLEANLPETERTTIVHGDFRPGNALFAETAPARVKAMLDWEMATLGDPLADVGYLTIFWSEPGDPEMLFDLSPVTRREGFLRREQLAALYAERSGRPLQHLAWYQTLALWKTSVFMEGNFKRAQLGASDDPFLKEFADGPVEIATRARQVGPEGGGG
jgi:aminoglycoside phosphotransferase (APT) family kinase protein